MQIGFSTQNILSLQMIMFSLVEVELCPRDPHQTCMPRSMMGFEFIALHKVREEAK